MGFYEFKEEDAIAFARHVNIKTKIVRDELVFEKCPYCGNSTTKRFKFAINLKSGLFNCFRGSCGAKGNMINLSRDFDFRISNEVDRYYNIQNTNGEFRKFKDAHRVTESRDEAVAYLQSRGISERICRQYEITVCEEQKNVLIFPFKDAEGELRFIKYRNVTYQKGDKGSKEWCATGCMPILFGMNHCIDFERLVITEGQMDSLSVAECGVPNAVSVPIGMNGFTWIPHCWDWMQKFKEIVVFGDCEKGRISLADYLKVRFPLKVKVARVEDYQGYKDANDILQNLGKEAVLNVINNAEGVSSKKLKCMSEVEKVDVESVTTISTGIRPIDKILTGGFKVGSVVLQSGKRGNGKSTIASQYAVEGLAQGFNVFMYSGELPDFFVKNWIDRQIYGKNQLTNSEIDKCNDWYRNRLFIYDNNAVVEEESSEYESLLTTMEQAIIQKECKLCILDNLMSALEDCSSNEMLYRSQSNFVGKLAKLAKKYEAVIILVAHPRKSINAEFTNDDVSGSSDITNKVDVVMSYDKVQHKNKEDDDPTERELRITKNRLTGETGTVLLYFEKDSKRITDSSRNFARDYLGNDGFEQINIPEEIPFT